uniref:Rieske domain-containing protein n=1 Tax=Chelydra serpentina TaxID=8475 RepID=A0A8C3XP13_CHESE
GTGECGGHAWHGALAGLVLTDPVSVPIPTPRSEEAKTTTWLHPHTREAMITRHHSAGNGPAACEYRSPAPYPPGASPPYPNRFLTLTPPQPSLHPTPAPGPTT